MKKLCLTLVSLFMLVAWSPAEKLGDVEMPDNLEVGQSNLMLNGAGWRKKVFIKVYACGLYLTKKSDDAKSVIAADEAMAIRMHFTYEVGTEKLVGAWNEGFANSGSDLAALDAHIKAFNALFDATAKKGDVYEVRYHPGTGVEVYYNGSLKGTVNGGLAFKQALFSIWLGDKPADTKLKKELI